MEFLLWQCPRCGLIHCESKALNSNQIFANNRWFSVRQTVVQIVDYLCRHSILRSRLSWNSIRMVYVHWWYMWYHACLYGWPEAEGPRNLYVVLTLVNIYCKDVFQAEAAINNLLQVVIGWNGVGTFITIAVALCRHMVWNMHLVHSIKINSPIGYCIDNTLLVSVCVWRLLHEMLSWLH